MKTSNLIDKQPIYKVEGDHLISKTGCVTLAYELDLPEIYTQSESEFKALHDLWSRALKLLPKFTVVHKQDWYFEDKFQGIDVDGELTVLSKSYDAHFSERPFLNHKSYLFLTKGTKESTQISSLGTIFTRGNIVNPQLLDQQSFDDFYDSVAKFSSILSHGSVKLKQLSTQQIVGTRKKKGLLEKYFTLDNQEDRSVLEDINLEESIVGNKKILFYTLSSLDHLPNELSSYKRYEKYSSEKTDFKLSLAAPMGIPLSCNHIYNQYIFIEDEDEVMNSLKKNARNLSSFEKYSSENENNLKSHKDFFNEHERNQHIPVKSHYNVLAWIDGSSPAAYREVSNQISSAFLKMNCYAHLNKRNVGNLFWAGVPGNGADLPSEEKFILFAHQATCLLTTETNYHSSVGLKGIKFVDRFGRPVLVDLSDEPMKKRVITNRNKFVLGPSGTGKSYLVNHMIRQYHEQGAHVLMVDVGNSYKRLCELKDGVYFTYDEKNPLSFNPFWDENLTPSIEKRETLKTLIFTLWKKQPADHSKEEYALLSDAINLYYEFLRQRPNIFPCFNTFYEFMRDGYSKVIERKSRHEMFNMASFLTVLEAFYRGGEFEHILNSRKRLDLTNESFIVFELDNIQDHRLLFSIVTLVIMETFISKMRTLKGVKKMILIEEAWKAITKEGMDEFMRYLYKTVRKYYGEAWVVTQEPADLVGNAVVKSTILDNADTKILLDQSKYEDETKFAAVQQLLSLTQKEKELVLSINRDNRKDAIYSEVFIGLGRTAKVYGVEVSPFEGATFNTNEDDGVLIDQNRLKYNGELVPALLQYVEDKKLAS